MHIAVILAGGSGSRFGNDIPKQFLKVNNKTILEYSIEAFEYHSLIDGIILVIKNDYISLTKEIICQNGYKKIKHIVPGGKERYKSSISAIEACKNDDDILLFHDCARPLVNERIISDCIAAMSRYNAVTVAVNTSDTIYISSSDGRITSIPCRSTLRNAQTPQCFRLSTIRSAYSNALRDTSFQPTDDCSVVFRYLPDEPIYIVEGDSSNIKITYKEDLIIMSQILNKKVKKCY